MVFEQQLAPVAHLRSDTSTKVYACWQSLLRAPVVLVLAHRFDSPGCCVVSCLVAQLQFVVRRGNFVVRGRLCGFLLS